MVDLEKSEDSESLDTKVTELYKNSLEEIEDLVIFETSVKIFNFFKVPVLLFFCIFLGFISSKLHYSYIFLFISLYFVYFIVNRNINRYKRSVRNVITKELEKNKVLNKWESLEWCNYIMERYWMVFEPMVSNFVLRYLNIMFEESCPPFISRLRLTEFTLGNISPFIKRVKFDECSENIILYFDMGFLPIENMTRQFLDDTLIDQIKYSSRIVIVARLGSSVKGIGLDVPILATNITFKGVLKVEMKFSDALPFVEIVNLSFVTQPFIDFSIKPLKKIDIRYIPGISNWLFTIIKNSLNKLMVEPNNLSLDLTDINGIFGKPVGVVLIHLLKYQNKRKNDNIYNFDIRLDGKKRFYSKDFSYTDSYINEYFYLIVENNDINIEFVLKESVSIENISAIGVIKIEKIKLMNNHKEDIRLFSRGDVEHTIECSFAYYPIKPAGKKTATNSAIVGVEIIEAEDLHGYGFNKQETYNSFCTLFVTDKSFFTKKKKDISLNPLSIFKQSVIMIKKALNAPGGFVLDTNFDAIESFPYPSSYNSLYVNNTKKILDSRSPVFEQPFIFLSRDISNDMMRIEIKDQNITSDEVKCLGQVELCMNDISYNTDKWYKLKNTRDGRIHLNFTKYSVDLRGKEELFKNYKNIIKIKIIELKTIYDEGEYFIVIKNNTETFFIRGFLIGEFPIQRKIIMPIENENNIKLYLFKKNLKEDEFIGECEIPDNCFNKNTELILKNENISVATIKLELLEFELYKNNKIDNKNLSLKLIQLKFYEIINNFDIQDFYFEFYNTNDVIFDSKISYKNTITQIFTFLVSELDIKCALKSTKAKSNMTHANFIVPNQNFKGIIQLSKSSSAFIETKVQYSNIEISNYFKTARLTIKIISCSNIKPVDRGSADTYVRLVHNGTKIYKTKVYQRNTNPIFNESKEITVRLTTDILRFEVKDWNKFMKYTLISFVEFPLNFMDEDKCKLSLTLIDAETLLKSESKIELELMIKP